MGGQGSERQTRGAASTRRSSAQDTLPLPTAATTTTTTITPRTRLKIGLPGARMLLRPRTLLLCIVAFFITVLTPARKEECRSAAHSALTSVGVPLPNRFPRVHLSLRVR